MMQYVLPLKSLHTATIPQKIVPIKQASKKMFINKTQCMLDSLILFFYLQFSLHLKTVGMQE